MNKYILIFLFAFTGMCFPVSGQTAKGSWLMGGNGSFDFNGKAGVPSNQDPFWRFEGSLSPTIGFFVFNNFAVGTSIPLSISAAADYNSHSIGAGLLARYYFGKSRIKVFPEASIEFNRLVYEYKQPLTEFSNTSRTNTYKVGSGITYFIANNLALEGVLNFYTVAGKYNRNYSYAGIDRQGINFNIGFLFYLPGKQ